MKAIVIVFVISLTEINFGQALCAQEIKKASDSKKTRSNVKYKVNRSGQYLQVSLLQGYWSDNADNNAIFYIKGKRVFFFDHISDVENEKEYRTYWSVSNNKLSFRYTGGLIVTDKILKLTKDSLVLHRKDIGTSRYVRLK